MNRLINALGFIAVLMLGGCAGAMATQTPKPITQKVTQVAASESSLSPKSEMIYRILVAELAGKRGQVEVALEHYRAVAQLSNNPRVSERAAGIALFVKDYPAILETAQRWYMLEADNQRARQTLVMALLRNQRLDEALEHLDDLRTQALDDGQEGFSMISSLLAQVEDRQQVFEVMERLLEHYPESPYALYYYALAAVGIESYEQALTRLDSALKIKTEWPQAQLLRGQVMADMGNIDGAVAGLAQAVEIQPENQVLRLGYARLLMGSERLQEAETQLERLVEDHPKSVEALYILGLLSAEMEKLDEAVTYYMRVLYLGKRLMETYYELGRVEELRGNYQVARDWYARVKDQDRFLSAQVRIGAMSIHLGDLEAMSAHMEVLRRDHPDNVIDLYIAESEILRETGHYQQAFERLDQALEAHADDQDLRYARALAAEKVDRLDVLEQDLQLLIDADPENGHALNALGYTLADRTNRYQEALGYLERAIALLPEDAAVLDSMGWIKYRLGHHEVSLDYLRRAYNLYSDAEIAAHLSEVLWASGQQKEAREIWFKAKEQEPESELLLKLKEKLGW